MIDKKQDGPKIFEFEFDVKEESKCPRVGGASEWTDLNYWLPAVKFNDIPATKVKSSSCFSYCFPYC